MQPQLCVLNACAKGVAIVRETVFESRWSHVPELRRMGVECDFVDADGDDAVANANANANANAGRALRIVGVGARGLRRADVRGSDLRASAALIVAGLAVMAPMGDGDGDGDGDGEAQGPTRVAGLAHLDRGYEGLDAKLRGVGADVERRPVPPRK
jgi:UDP-N-acetylglucosamine 1-carboxyvinyltransferase